MHQFQAAALLQSVKTKEKKKRTVYIRLSFLFAYLCAGTGV